MHYLADVAVAALVGVGYLGGKYLNVVLCSLIAISAVMALAAHGLRLDIVTRVILLGLGVCAAAIGASTLLFPGAVLFWFGLCQVFLAALMVRRFLFPALATMRAKR